MANDCSFPKGFSLSYLIYGMIITGFFANFYIQSYIKSLCSSSTVSKPANGVSLVNKTK